MSRARIYEPSGTSETTLKYTAGMVLAVPVDCDLVNVQDVSLVRLAIKTPDQKVVLLTPKSTDFCDKGNNCYRLFTSALMSHAVWSEALHVEISVVLLDSPQYQTSTKSFLMTSSNSSSIGSQGQHQFVSICEPVKVLVLPKPIKRGI